MIHRIRPVIFLVLSFFTVLPAFADKGQNPLFYAEMKEGKVWFEIPDSLIGREFLLGSTISRTSDSGNGIEGCMPSDPIHFTLTDEGRDVAMRIVRSNEIYPSQSSSKGAIFRLFKKEKAVHDTACFRLDVTDLFLSDEKNMSPFDPHSHNLGGKREGRSESFIKSRSFIEEVKAFEDNVSVRSSLSYKYTLSGKGAAGRDIPFTSSVVRSIVLLDTVPYRPRMTDSRVAVFPTEKLKYSSDFQESKKIYYADRWRLEPSDVEAFRKGEKVEPVKPVVFYVDSAFPGKWVPYIKEGIEQWNELFEEIGFKNAVRALDFPEDDPQFDPDNIKYSCVRYAPVPVQNAMGPSWVDPRSGEIISASVYVYHDVMELLNNWLFVQTSQVDDRVRHRHIPDTIIGDALRYVISHEVGHCLGFMHNMGGSSVIPTDSLRSATFTIAHGTTESIMDYARFNYVAQPEDAGKGLRLTPPRFGRYDHFLVRWNYTPTFAEDVQKDYEIVSAWVSEALEDPVFRYGKQQAGGLDPRSQTEDLGDDPVKSSEYGISNLKYILSHLNEWLAMEDDDFSYRKTIFNAIVNQYATYLGHVLNCVGGMNLYERFENDPGVNVKCVEASYQRAAMAFLLNQARDLKWLDNESVLDHFRPQELPSVTVGRYLMGLVMDAPSRAELCALKSSDPFTPQECMDMIFDSVWRPLTDGRMEDGDFERQELYAKLVCSQAGLNYPERSSRALSSPALPLPPPSVLGYEETGAILYENRLQSGEMYSYVLKMEKLLKKGAKSRDERLAGHCRSILFNIEKSVE